MEKEAFKRIEPVQTDNRAQTFTLKSNEVGGQLTSKLFATDYSGENTSPELQWKKTPNQTNAFALTMYDADAHTGGGLWHWVVNNIPSSVTSLAIDAATNRLPNGL